MRSTGCSESDRGRDVCNADIVVITGLSPGRQVERYREDFREGPCLEAVA
jgi:hypothetical protein